MEQPNRKLILRIQGPSVAESNQLAAELRQSVLDASPDVEARISREGEASQDFGASLVLVLGTPAVIAVAKGIQAWLKRRPAATLEMEENGSLKATNLTSRDARRIVEILSESTENG